MAIKYQANSSSHNIPVSYENYEGETENFTLRRATAAGRAKFVDARTSAIKVNDAGRIVGVAAGELPSLLVSLCLRDQSGLLVGLDKVNTFDGDFVEQLFEECLDLCNLRENDKSLLKMIQDLLDHKKSGTSWEKIKALLKEPDFADTSYSPLRTLLNDKEDKKEAENF